jgi:hypothetical protein
MTGHIVFERDTKLGHWVADVNLEHDTVDVTLNGAHLDVRPMPAPDLGQLRAQGYHQVDED